MSFSRKLLAFAAALAGATCSSPAGTFLPASQSYLDLRVVSGPALNNADIHLAADQDSLIVRATVLGDPAAYETPTVTAADPAMIESRSDGSARVLRPASIALTATAEARSPATRPAVLRATGTLSIACLAYAAAAVNLTIVDSLSGAGISGPGNIRLAVTDGVYTDSLRTTSFYSSWGAAYERPGTYTATVDADGYLPWRKDGIVVTRGLCHVRPVGVTARLVRR